VTFDRDPRLAGTILLDQIQVITAELELSGWSDMPEYEAVGLSVGIEAVLEYSGRKSPRVRVEREGGLVRFHLAWR
jgi:hypothetical protein